MSLLSRFAAWLALLDERQGKLENPIARLSGREFYAFATAAVFAMVLLLAIAWRSGVNAGVGQLPYRAAGHSVNTGGSSAYAPTVQGDLSQQSSTH
jgi:hypothetical protein